MFLKWIFVFLVCAVSFIESAKILAVFPMPAPSHYILGSSLIKGLAERGHDVTMISPFREKNIPTDWKYRDVVIDGIQEEFKKGQNDTINMFQLSGTHPLIYLFLSNNIENLVTNFTLRHPNVQILMKSNEKFDVVIVQQFVSNGLTGLAHHFNAHLVLFSTIGANGRINPLFGNPSPPSYVPEISLGYSSEMTFMERIKNSLYIITSELNKHLIHLPAQNKILKEYLPNAPDVRVLNCNASLAFLNSHVSSNQPVPLQPNMIEIGGFHVKPSKKLPDDLQEYLDNAKEGVIYFSMGSNLKSKNLPADKQEAILNTIRKLKENVLWKWEDGTLPGQPTNVKLGKWLPQQDILAHPNVKLFITHGGLLSTTETLYHGVPVLAIPVYGDQESNAALTVNNGFGQVIKYSELNEEKFTKALNELLTNPKYKENAKKRSKIMHDRVVKPLDLANYWIEYIIRHNGAPHLRSAAMKLPWYQYHLLDVIALLFVSFSLVLYINYIIFKKILQRICKKTSSKKQKQN